MKIKVESKTLNEALGVASLVPPTTIVSSSNSASGQGSGYLFEVKDGKCSIHSRDQTHRVKVNVPILDAEGDGLFICPLAIVGGLKYLDGWIDIEFGHNKDEDLYWLKYTTEGGATSEVSTFDPRLMKTIDDEISGDTYEVPSAILKDALVCVNAHVATANNDRVGEVYKTLQLFDASLSGGDGTMYGADNIRTCYYYSPTLCGKVFSINTRHVGLVTSFLSKFNGSAMKIHMGEAVRFVEAPDGSAVGWAGSVEEHKRFRYYAYKNDRYVLAIPKTELVRAVKHVSAGKIEKIRVEYNHENRSLQFHARGPSGLISSTPVVTTPLTEDDEEFGGLDADSKSFGANISTDHIKGMIEPVRGHQVILRVFIMPESKNRREMALFRTVEEYHLNDNGKEVISDDEGEEAHLCRVTRYAPSMG
jgi:hypothetical protein